MPSSLSFDLWQLHQQIHVIKPQIQIQNKMGNGEEICGLPLEAAYGVEKGRAIKPETEDMNTMLPLPEAFSNGYASWLKWSDASKFVLITLEISSSVTSTVDFNDDNVLPALFTLFK